MGEVAIVVRMATSADIDAAKAFAIEGESCAIDVDGQLAAVLNEYGAATPTTRWDSPELIQWLENLGTYASELWTYSNVQGDVPDYDPDNRGWVIVVQDVDTDIVWDVYNREPTVEDVHSVVCDFYSRCGWPLPRKRTNQIYYTGEDMPDHCGLTIGRLGQSLGYPLSR